MEQRCLSYFVADVHLGLRTADPVEREERFLKFLDGIPVERTRTLWLLGDIWDFWYEYRDVVPREGARVVARLIMLMNAGVEVCFFPGNHDIWTYSFFESLGMKKFSQPALVEIDGRSFCLGHGDCLGKVERSYVFMLSVFRNKLAQRLFSSLHPWLGYRLGLRWSNSSRRSHKGYVFDPENNPLRGYVEEYAAAHKVDYFIFGHYHQNLDTTLAGGERFVIVGDWLSGGMPHAVFDGRELITSF